MAELADLYKRVDADVRKVNATCMGGGTCCRFDLMGHRLFLSTGELALLSRLKPPQPNPLPGRCPYQIGPRCTARTGRPLGCRVFFCKDNLQDWCNRTYEKYHRQVRRLHEKYSLDYSYSELTGAVAEIFCFEKIR